MTAGTTRALAQQIVQYITQAGQWTVADLDIPDSEYNVDRLEDSDFFPVTVAHIADILRQVRREPEPADESADEPVEASEPAAAPAGRPAMATKHDPGGFGAWLVTAKPGAVWWSDKTFKGLSMQIKRSGRKVRTKLFFAVSDDLQAVRLIRAEVLA